MRYRHRQDMNDGQKIQKRSVKHTTCGHVWRTKTIFPDKCHHCGRRIRGDDLEWLNVDE